MEKRQVEVLAPAGSFESMKAAVAAGADAVYMGGSRFGARAYAENFSEERFRREFYKEVEAASAAVAR